MSTPDLKQIGSEVIDLGLLIGLLKGTKPDPTPNLEWFPHPKDDLTKAFNWPHLKPVFESFLKKGENPIDKDGSIFNENWYPVKVDDGKGGTKKSGFYIVQKTMDPLALLGLGLHKEFKFRDAVTINPFVFAPVFQMPNKVGTAEPAFAAAKNGPIEIGFKLHVDIERVKFLGSKAVLFWVVFDLKDNSITPKIELIDPVKTHSNDIPSPEEILNKVLGIDGVKDFLKKKIIAGNETITTTWADLLKTLGWLVEEADGTYKVGEIKIPPGKEVLDYVIKSIKKAFEKFIKDDHEFVLMEHKAVGEEDEPTWKISLVKKGGRYGVNIEVADVVLREGPEVIKLQIGNATADGTDWLEKTAAEGTAPDTNGISFYLLSDDTNGLDISFDPQFEAVNVGFDISNVDEQPLFNVNGYTLQGAQLRGYYSSISSDENSANAWGVAAALNNVAIPLGPPATGEGVAQTLLASGAAPEEPKATEEGDKKPSVNPSFSLLAAYQSKFYLQLFDEDGKPQDIVSIPLHKSFGPVALKDVGIGWNDTDKALLFQLSGGLNLNALKLELDKLTVGIPIDSPDKPELFSLGLEGFDLAFKSGAVSMAGGFLKYMKNPASETEQPQYNGAVAIQAGSWGITALGSFGTAEGSPSLFIFGVLNAALGGPPVFFVTALAAGFGYNRKIIMPGISNVQNFPFVKAAVNPELFTGKDSDTVLASMSEVIPPELGQYWFAAGVKFSSFELLNSFALLIIQFGKKLELGILGLSNLQLPKIGTDGAVKPYVNAQMAIKATFDPEEGILAVQAQLTDNSYVIHPDCKITGGFAYFSWFKGDHADDFVVTLGGYNKNFDLAAHPHYPLVPRLAFNWNMPGGIKFSGDAYFALTPSCVMAGGKLSLTYEEGDLKAWFKAIADFLISWKPFHYDIGIGITVGVSYRVNIAFIHKTISVELGVDVQMWGPEFGGQAEVHLWIISFTIGFGANNTAVESVDWQKFYDYFLVTNDTKAQVQAGAEEPNLGAVRKIITINTNAGLKTTVKNGKEDVWLVDPGTFSFNALSVFPVSTISFVGPDAPADVEGKVFGAKPIGNITFSGKSSNFIFGLNKWDGNDFKAYSLKDWTLQVNKQSVPEAMYGEVKDVKEKPAAKLIGGVTKGLATIAPPVQQPKGPQQFPVTNISYSMVPHKKYGLVPAQASEISLQSAGSLDKIKSTLNNEAVKKERNNIFEALGAIGSLANANSDMKHMAQAPENIFQGSPMLADAAATAQPLQAKERVLAAARSTLRRDAVLVTGHQLKATIIKYAFGRVGQTGLVLRGGVNNTAASKSRYNPSPIINTFGSFGDVNTFNLNPGLLQVWELDTSAGGDHLYHAGAFPVRMILFDEHLRVISDRVLSGAGVSTENVPAGASQMCLQGLSSPDAMIAGWHEQSSLALINPKYLVGKGCLIRPKKSQSVGVKQYLYDTGLVTGRSLVLNNSDGDDTQQGWIETRFAAGIKQVFVLARPDADATNDVPEFDNLVRLIYADKEGNKTSVDLVPDLAGANGREQWTGYTIPKVAGDSHFSIWAATSSVNGLQLAGVAGTAEPLTAWTAAHSTELKTHDANVNAGNAKNKLSVGLKKPINF
jgi:hypothetical protein